VPAARPTSTALYANDSAIANLALTATSLADPQDETNNNKLAESGLEHNYTNISSAVEEDDAQSGAHLYMNIVPGTDYTVQDFQVGNRVLETCFLLTFVIN